jgi:hypothetical protein
LAVRHTTTTKIPGFTPNTGVPQSLKVSAGVIFGVSGSLPPASYYTLRFALVVEGNWERVGWNLWCVSASMDWVFKDTDGG